MGSEPLPMSFYAGFDNDPKAEVIAAQLVELGISADRILIVPIGGSQRPHSNDVVSIEETESDYDNHAYVIVKSPREGLYDSLPEGLFHEPSAHNSASTNSETLETIQRRRMQQENARKFFLPFEASINYLRMQMTLYENRLDKSEHYDDLARIFAGDWEIFEFLDTRQTNIFLQLIPILHDLRDDYPAIETIMRVIFRLPVEISLRRQKPGHAPEIQLPKLGAGLLGVDFITASQQYDEGSEEILVSIGPVENQVFQDFSGMGKKGKILELLCNYLLPAQLDIATEFSFRQREKITRLAGKEHFANSVLGADTYL